jgi:hypothetical protein
MNVDQTARAESASLTEARDVAWRQANNLLNSGGLNRNGLLKPVGTTEELYFTTGGYTSCAVATLDTSQRLAHTISFMDEETPTKKAKPAGVLGAEIWVKIGDTPPADPSELSFLALDTNTPYLAEYTGAQAGKKAHYMLRWVDTRGDKGPWSETARATIAG